MAASPTFRPSAFKSHTQVELDDHYLIALAKQGKKDAYDRIVKRYFGFVRLKATVNISGFAPEAIEVLVSAPWPGNVRQLLNVIEQAVALAATEVIPESLVRQALDAGDTALTPLDEARRAFERDYLVRILKITGGNVTKAARRLVDSLETAAPPKNREIEAAKARARAAERMPPVGNIRKPMLRSAVGSWWTVAPRCRMSPTPGPGLPGRPASLPARAPTAAPC